MSKGGGGSTETTSTVYQSDLPAYAQPYVERIMQRAEAESLRPYEAYGGPRIAGISGDTLNAQQLIRDVGTTIPGMDQAKQGTLGAIGSAQNAMNRGYASQGIADLYAQQGIGQSQQYTGAANMYGGQAAQNAYSGANYGMGQAMTAEQRAQQGIIDAQAAASAAQGDINNVSAAQQAASGVAGGVANMDPAQFSQFGYGPAGTFTGGSVDQYMSPYMQNVVDVQKDAAVRDFDQAQASRDAAAVQAGAFGNSRAGVVDALAQEDLSRQLGQIQATGQQQAFDTATQLYEQDRAARMAQEQAQAQELGRVQAGAEQGAIARGQLGLESGGLQLQSGELGLGAADRRLAAGQLGLSAGQLGLGAGELGLSAADRQIAASQVGLGAGELGMSAADRALAQGQLGLGMGELGATYAGLGLEGAGMQGDLYNQFAGMGADQRMAAIEQAGLLQGIGSDQRAYQQQMMDIAYQDFLTQRDYPYQQLERFRGIISGTPMGTTSTQAQFQQANPFKDVMGAGISAVGLSQAMGE